MKASINANDIFNKMDGVLTPRIWFEMRNDYTRNLSESDIWVPIFTNPQNYFDSVEVVDDGSGAQKVTITLTDEKFYNLERAVEFSLLKRSIAPDFAQDVGYPDSSLKSINLEDLETNEKFYLQTIYKQDTIVSCRIRIGYATNFSDEDSGIESESGQQGAYRGRFLKDAQFENRTNVSNSAKMVLRTPWIYLMVMNINWNVSGRGLGVVIEATSVQSCLFDKLKLLEQNAVHRGLPHELLDYYKQALFDIGFGNEVQFGDWDKTPRTVETPNSPSYNTSEDKKNRIKELVKKFDPWGEYRHILKDIVFKECVRIEQTSLDAAIKSEIKTLINEALFNSVVVCLSNVHNRIKNNTYEPFSRDIINGLNLKARIDKYLPISINPNTNKNLSNYEIYDNIKTDLSEMQNLLTDIAAQERENAKNEESVPKSVECPKSELPILPRAKENEDKKLQRFIEVDIGSGYTVEGQGIDKKYVPNFRSFKSVFENICAMVPVKYVNVDNNNVLNGKISENISDYGSGVFNEEFDASNNDSWDPDKYFTAQYKMYTETVNNKTYVYFRYASKEDKYKNQKFIRQYNWREHGDSIILNLNLNSNTLYCQMNLSLLNKNENGDYNISSYSANGETMIPMSRANLTNTNIISTLEKMPFLVSTNTIQDAASNDDNSIVGRSAMVKFLKNIEASLYEGTIEIPGDPFYFFDRNMEIMGYFIRINVFRRNLQNGELEVSKYLSGDYYLTGINHKIDSSGYKTILNISKFPDFLKSK